MNSKEKLISLLTELGETVGAANGHVMVIGTLPTEEEDKRALILSIRGNERMLSAAVAKMLQGDNVGSRIILRGPDIAAECISRRENSKKKHNIIMKKKHNNVLKWLCMALICCWGLSAFFLLASDVNPYKNVSAEMFVWLKVFGVVSLLLCCYAGKILFNAGLLPGELENY